MSSSETPRPYRSELRRRQAAETRRRVVEAAAETFARHGYQATTFAKIAKRADVSVVTVQKLGTKPALLQAAVELTSFGFEGETDLFATEVGRALLQIQDPDTLARFFGSAMLAINAPSAGVWMAVGVGAHGSPELRELQATMLRLIRGQVEHVLDHIARRGWLRQDVPVDDLVEAFCVITSVDAYVRFVERDGRSPEQYSAFVARTIRETILAP